MYILNPSFFGILMFTRDSLYYKAYLLNNSLLGNLFAFCCHTCAGCKICDIVQVRFTDVLVPGFPGILCSYGFWKLWWILSLLLGLTFVVFLVLHICSYFLPCPPDVARGNQPIPFFAVVTHGMPTDTYLPTVFHSPRTSKKLCLRTKENQG